MTTLPEPVRVVQLPDGTYTYADAAHLPAPQAPQQIVQHIHQAPPDRTTQRIALGTGIGAGTVAAGVYFGPLLVAALSSMAISLAVVALVAVAAAWGVVTVVRSVGGDDGKAAATNIAKATRRRR
ncbi:hypothetical protein FNJ62_10220 [Streptomyces benahoarensis]|uniref:Uncharacterized protein n=1 Tax=Streptomyces benahoarensis TaxID=2595054 RepID=A0A553ZPC4_9ACTN|nr:DUF6251 family protein [Streptomyces benahoarensis]TSB28285.1 hypothetical protein FNJ62_10220 [Streptomyces benahoarensis]TSB43319.1 hypothetical protein FNZ23_05185 [Streptomyces benahoarensis]